MEDYVMEEIQVRLDRIEDVLKMMLVNDVLNNDNMEILALRTATKVSELLSPLGMKNIRLNYIEGEYYIFAEPDLSGSFFDIRKKYKEAESLVNNYKLVLAFKQLHPGLKRKLMASKISFFSPEGESCFY